MTFQYPDELLVFHPGLMAPIRWGSGKRNAFRSGFEAFWTGKPYQARTWASRAYNQAYNFGYRVVQYLRDLEEAKKRHRAEVSKKLIPQLEELISCPQKK